MLKHCQRVKITCLDPRMSDRIVPFNGRLQRRPAHSGVAWPPNETCHWLRMICFFYKSYSYDNTKTWKLDRQRKYHRISPITQWNCMIIEDFSYLNQVGCPPSHSSIRSVSIAGSDHTHKESQTPSISRLARTSTFPLISFFSLPGISKQRVNPIHNVGHWSQHEIIRWQLPLRAD